MIRSMTGFGAAAEKIDGTAYSLEIRSVNNRYLKTQIRLPEEITCLETDLEAVVREYLSRGSVVLNISMRSDEVDASSMINQTALQSYVDQLRSVSTDQNATIDLSQLLQLPGVLQAPESDAMVEQHKANLVKLTQAACENLQAMREREGQGLMSDLQNHGQMIGEALKEIIVLAPNVVKEYEQRLQNRVAQLAEQARLEIDAVDLTREVAIYAERCDISEECQRLNAHLEQLEKILKNEQAEPIGRTLDFLSQELLREANTIASKSNDAQISQKIVAIKGEIDRIKEQVQNVE